MLYTTYIDLHTCALPPHGSEHRVVRVVDSRGVQLVEVHAWPALAAEDDGLDVFHGGVLRQPGDDGDVVEILFIGAHFGRVLTVYDRFGGGHWLISWREPVSSSGHEKAGHGHV